MKTRTHTKSLKLKLLVPLFVSILVGLCFAVAIVVQTESNSRELKKSVRNLEFLRATSVLIQALQDERGMTDRYISREIIQDAIREQYDITDKAIAEFRPYLEGARFAEEIKENVNRSIDALPI
jgi:ABC-type arginine/histidine transport system permease subunit